MINYLQPLSLLLLLVEGRQRVDDRALPHPCIHLLHLHHMHLSHHSTHVRVAITDVPCGEIRTYVHVFSI
jgi:hypothetical protein